MVQPTPKIVAQVRDDLANGALMGAGVGLSAALAALAIAGSRDNYVLPLAKWGPPGTQHVRGVARNNCALSQVLHLTVGSERPP